MIKSKLPKSMKAVGFYKYYESLLDLEVSVPEILKTQVLVEVKAVAVNPIDIKQRALTATLVTTPRILGWDGAGIIVENGEEAKQFNVGDEVIFTGKISDNGANAQYVALDEVTVAPKPKNLTFEQAAAMPLTAVTAYEALYDRLLLSEKDKGKTLLIINSAGGVGSVASQLAKLLGLKVIGTASRNESTQFSQKHGVDIVLNHRQDLIPQLKASGFGNGVDYIMVNYDPYPYWDTLMKAIKPQGKICLVVDSSGLVDLRPLKDKSVTLVCEMMSTRLKYNTDDKNRHNEILRKIVEMLEKGLITTTLTKTMSPINADNLLEAHKLLQEQHLVGKLVLSGF